MSIATRCLVLFAFAGAVTAQDPPVPASAELETIQAKFIGHYELVKYQTFRADGTAVDLDYVGRIMYDAFGNMSAIGTPRDLPTREREAGQRRTGGFAYFGKVSFDLDQGIVVHHVEGSPTFGGWVGRENVRYFEFRDGLLHLSLKDRSGRVTGTLSWRKIED